MLRYTSVLLAGAALAGCASVPDVTYTYYLSKSQVTASVAQTVTCNKDVPVIGYGAPAVTPAYIADFGKPEKISLHDLNSAFADNSFSLTLANDGRLLSSNASWTGQGQMILQSAISLGTTALALGAGAPAAETALTTTSKTKTKAKPKPPAVCDIVAKNAPDGKTLTFLYSNIAAPADLGGPLPAGDKFKLMLPPGSDSERVLAELRDPKLKFDIPTEFTLKIEQAFANEPLIVPNSTAPRYPAHLTVQKMVRAFYKVQVNGSSLAAGNIVVPKTYGADDTYDVPITGATFFGNQSYQLTLASDGTGAMTGSTYGDNAGTTTSNVINVVNTGLTALKPPSPPPTP